MKQFSLLEIVAALLLLLLPLLAVDLEAVQHPNLPVIGYAWSALMRDSQGRDSFTEDALLSAWD